MMAFTGTGAFLGLPRTILMVSELVPHAGPSAAATVCKKQRGRALLPGQCFLLHFAGWGFE